MATHAGSLSTVRLLLEKGADPNQGSAMVYAIDSRRGDVVEALVNMGAKVKV